MKKPIALFAGGLLLGVTVIAGVFYIRGQTSGDGVGAELIAADSAALVADSTQLAAEDGAQDDGLADHDADSADLMAADSASHNALIVAATAADSVDGEVPTETAGSNVVASNDVVTTDDVVMAGDALLDRARLIRILGVMKPAEAVRILVELSDEEAVAVLGALSDRKAALLLAGLPPERAAAIGRIAMSERSGR